MTKEELARNLQLCIKTEESAIPIYTKHISDTFFLSIFSEQEKEAAVNILTMLSRESEGHATLFKALYSRVQGSGKDVY